jgi:hypothetical protein
MRSPLQILTSPSHELKVLLRNNIIGTPGKGMLYQHTTAAVKLKGMTKAYFVHLVRMAKIIGSCTFSVRQTSNNSIIYDSVYLRYFLFDQKIRRNSSRLVNKPMTGLRKMLEDLLDGDRFSLNHKHFYYAYYDPTNERSVLFCRQFKFEEVRTFESILFTRVVAKAALPKNRRVTEIVGAERNGMRRLLEKYYRSYSMFSFENLFTSGRYFVIKNESDEILAGVQVLSDAWKLLSLKPPFGRLKLALLSKLPYVSRVVSQNLSFLSVEGIYCKEGYARDLEQLLEHVLSIHKTHVAMTFVDEHSELKAIFEKMDLGVMGRANKGNKGKLICRFQNFSDEEKIGFRTRPAYISAIDLT